MEPEYSLPGSKSPPSPRPRVIFCNTVFPITVMRFTPLSAVRYRLFNTVFVAVLHIWTRTRHSVGTGKHILRKVCRNITKWSW